MSSQTNAEGRSNILFNASSNGLTGFEATISTAADQVANRLKNLGKSFMNVLGAVPLTFHRVTKYPEDLSYHTFRYHTFMVLSRMGTMSRFAA